MRDTSPEIESLHRAMLLERSGEDRFRMAMAMNQSARAIVAASLPTDLSEKDRRVQIFLRFYGSDFSETERAEIVSRIRRRRNTGVISTP